MPKGGKRKGAGRPKGTGLPAHDKKVVVTLRVHPTLLKVLEYSYGEADTELSFSAWLEDLLETHPRIKS